MTCIFWQQIAFQADGVDLAIRYGSPPFGTGLAAELLFEQEIIPICNPGLISVGAEPRDGQELSQYTLLHDAHNFWPEYIDRFLSGADPALFRSISFSQPRMPSKRRLPVRALPWRQRRLSHPMSRQAGFGKRSKASFALMPTSTACGRDIENQMQSTNCKVECGRKSGDLSSGMSAIGMKHPTVLRRAKAMPHTGIPSRDDHNVTSAAVTSGLTSAICDGVASGLKVEVTHGTLNVEAR